MRYKSVEEFRSKNNNKDFTLISRDCVGGALYHQLGLRFLSPTINLFMSPEDFNIFCLNLREYIFGELKEFKDAKVNYPVGMLYPRKESGLMNPVRIDFMHYSSFENAKEKWDERSKRINWDNIYVLSTITYKREIESISDNLIKNWNNISYKKVMLVNKRYGFNGEFVVNKPEKTEEYAWLLAKSEEGWGQEFNQFDFIKFLHKRMSLKELMKKLLSKKGS